MPALRSLLRSSLAALALGAAAVIPTSAAAFSPFLVVPDPAVAEASPAYRYANMSDAEAIAEIDRRGILYTKLDSVPGVRAPIRLTGRLHGVNVRSSLPPDQRVTSMFEILDARLALAIDELCAVLEKHDIDELVHFTMYRPNVSAPAHGLPEEAARVTPRKPAGARPRPEVTPIKGKPAARAEAPSLGKGALDGLPRAPAPRGERQKAGEAAKPEPPVIAAPAVKKPAAKTAARSAPKAAPVAPKAKKVAKRDAPASGLHQTTWAQPGTRHPAGLAIDVGLLRKRDGRWINVARDFHGKIGARTCGDGAPMPESEAARELRAIVCESAALGVFTYVLTPNYNAAHADHFHMEIKPGVKWFLHH